MNRAIFREYDIRGIVDRDLTLEIVETLGRGIGTWLKRRYKGDMVVGRDVRHSSKPFADALMKGLNACGLDCVELGMVPTPLLYYAVNREGPDSYCGGIMITGSHNPPDFNGFKICHGAVPVFGPDIQEIYELIEKKDFESGTGTVRRMDVVSDYIEEVAGQIEIARPVKVVVDCGNGVAGPVAIPLLKKIGCDVRPLFEEPDGNFPNHHPDPTVVKYIQQLIHETKSSDAELGVGYDGDADRIGAIDENGDILFGDTLTGIFSKPILAENPGGKILFDVKCSQGLVEAIRAFGGTPVMWKTGHSHLKNKLKVEKAPMAGEMSGHVFFADRYYGYDDAIYASCRLLEIVSKEKRPLSAIASDIPKYFTTPEIRIDCPDDLKFAVVEKMLKRFQDEYEVNDIDGARIDFPNGWGLIRSSNTQPVLVLRFEGKTAKDRDAIQREIVGALSEHIDIPAELKV
ncbi:MAG: phosphomannomutase/phosphoglucomutase [Gemmatimonadetes bacterium]|nr:phosphomannomutase/phosphoglucomutase [Gemmatimonadota bacterium]